MAASYPGSLPVKDAAGANLSTNPHSALHDDMYDEIVAIATELGTAPKGTFASVKARLDNLPAVGAWAAPTLLNSWANFGGGYQTPEYRKVGDDVQVRGVVGAGTLGSQVFTLPSGFRPLSQVQFITACPTGTNGVAVVEVAVTGAVVVINSVGASNTSVSLQFQFSTV